MNIIITGAGKGIGFETAKFLSNIKGNRVVAVSRNIEALKKYSNEIPGGKNGSFLYPISIDLNKKDFEKKFLNYILNRFKTIDILINNAGILVNKELSQLSSDDFDTIYTTNTKAPFIIIKALLPYFNNPSHIVNIGSMGGFQGSEKFPGLSLYSASKGALAILSECLAVELKEKGIRVNCLALGSTQTEMFADAFPGFKAQTTADVMAKYIAEFSLNKKQNGKTIAVTEATP